jgi:hypothetical protein
VESGSIHHIAVTANYVYVTSSSSGTVSRIPRQGGAPVVRVAAQELPLGIAVDSTNVYWANYTSRTIMKVPLEGTTPELLATVTQPPGKVAVDATHVYWLSSLFPEGTLGRVPIAGGTPVTLADGAEVVGAENLVVVGQWVYWTNFGPAGGSAGSLNKMPVNGGAITTLLTSIDAPSGLAISEGQAYVAYRAGVYRVSVDGGSPTQLVPNSLALAVAADSTGLYVGFGNDSAGMGLGRIAPGELQPTSLADFTKGISAVALEGTDVFWTLAGGDTRMTSKTP